MKNNKFLPLAIPDLSGNEEKYLNSCLTSSWISSKGIYIDRFEKKFAEFTGTKYAISTSNGTTALHLVLSALGCGPGDEVIVPDLTFVATANTVAYTGAKPVLADVERDSWSINIGEIRRKISGRTRGIIAVHLYGNPAEMEEILQIAGEHNLWVIEDAAEAHGAGIKIAGRWKKVGSIGIAGIFSFYGNKIITCGEGGMVTTGNRDLAEKMKILRDHGQDPLKRYYHPVIGYNYRLTNMQAAIGLAQLERINHFLKAKEKIAAGYRQKLERVKGLKFQEQNPGKKSVCWLFSMTIEPPYKLTRDQLMAVFEKNAVECRPFFHPLHTMPPYHEKKAYKEAEFLAGHGINLPSFVTITDSQIERVTEIIKHYASN